MANDDERSRRLAAALRENLRRRKAQARGSGDPAARPADQVPQNEPEDEKG